MEQSASGPARSGGTVPCAGCCRGDALHVEGLKVWARVGVLPEERSLGQWFELDATVWLDLSAVGQADDLALSIDYSKGIVAIQSLAEQLVCQTIEHFCERILNQLTSLYGERMMRLRLRKCHPPLPGFSGSVSVERWRFVNQQWKQAVATPHSPAEGSDRLKSGLSLD